MIIIVTGLKRVAWPPPAEPDHQSGTPILEQEPVFAQVNMFCCFFTILTKINTQFGTLAIYVKVFNKMIVYLDT